MNYFLLVAYLSMIFSCTSNPFWQDGERGFPAISGIATAEQNEFNTPIFVWIKELNISSYTQEGGQFSIPIQKSESNENIFSGTYNVYFFIHNYQMDSSSFNLADGYFSEIQDDFSTKGEMTKSIHLKNLIDGKLDLSFGSNQLNTEDSVRMTFSFLTKSDVQIQAYKFFFGQFENHSGIIFKPMGTGEPIFHRYSTTNSSGNIINDQMITLNYLGGEEVVWEYLIHTDSVDLLNVGYEVYPVYFIAHNYPSGMMESLGLDSLQNISENYFRMPSTIEPDFLSNIQNN
ncbi:MAG: hypothetical protein CMF99_04520 [Candidatus Marinimicrobia bacterium]|nr:hypothetical protein [Candidatus Neomarinimicrobiota bacterium]|tara:strand:- start:1427 stop:2290 length:864 start_codon:yes stop_codon:yes gene_type:complete